MHPKAALLSAMLLILSASGPASSEPPAPSLPSDSVEIDERSTLESFLLVGQALRVRFRTQALPSANFGATNVARYGPELQVRVRFPITRSAVGQVVSLFRSDRYDLGGPDVFRGEAPTGVGLGNFYTASVSVEAAHAVDFMPELMGGEELWSIVGGGRVRSRWQTGAFGEGVTGGGFVGISYELSKAIRVVAAISVESRLGRGGVAVNPLGTLVWQVSDRWRFRSRGVGGQLEYRVAPPVTLFASAYRDAPKFVLDREVPLEDPLVFRDRTKALVGGGFHWQITPYVRLVAEGGAALSRKLQLRSGDDKRIYSDEADAHGYFELRLYAGGVGTARALDSGARR